MAYFNELPNLEVVSRFPNQSSNQDYTTIKNLWRRAKLREDIANAITAFNYYQIQDNERPDQVAEKFYGDPELDWVILITNNITNINEDWPIDNDSFYNYLLDKYGSEEAIQDVHHTETVDDRDNYDRLVVPGGLIIDDARNLRKSFNTVQNQESYQLENFPSENSLTTTSVNLIQVLNITLRDLSSVNHLVPNILIETSKLKVGTRDNGEVDITVNNDLATFWPSGWGGSISIKGRSGNKIIQVGDILSSEYTINIPERLYEITGELVNEKIIPVFKFVYKPIG